MQKKNNYSIIPELKLSKIVHLLGTILGLVIKEQEGNSFFNKIEKIRVLSKESRGKRNKLKIQQSFNKLKSQISNLTAQESLIIARSFNKFLNFSNLAESLYSVHMIHDHNIRKSQGTNEVVVLEEAIINLLKDKTI